MRDYLASRYPSLCEEEHKAQRVNGNVNGKVAITLQRLVWVNTII